MNTDSYLVILSKMDSTTLMKRLKTTEIATEYATRKIALIEQVLRDPEWAKETVENMKKEMKLDNKEALAIRIILAHRSSDVTALRALGVEI